jgi:hypothetical protein
MPAPNALAYRELKTSIGNVRLTVFKDKDDIRLTIWNPVSVSLPLTRRDVEDLIGASNELLKVYDTQVKSDEPE